jgi:two-component system cell cycle sensor histidine kinase/response regulator CckA
MAAGVVHELNQPLNIIRMATDLTRASLHKNSSAADPELVSEQLSVIGGQTRQMAETVQSMRIFSRDDYGRKIAFDAVRATNQALSWLRPDLAEHRIEVSFQAPPQCPRVFGEPSRFEQVMMNLILNARDAVRQRRSDGLIDDCEIEIRVTCQRSVDTVFITVRDNGGGVPDGHIERVFEPFFTTKEPGEGTGLGLSISYGIIGGIDGELTVRNHGEGAEFTIKLPCVAPKNVAEATISEENRG